MNRPLTADSAPAPAAERRRHGRVADVFPLTLVPLRGPFGGRPVRGLAKNYDAAAACLRSSTPLPVGRRVRVRLHLPRSIGTFFRGLPCEFPARVIQTRRLESGKGAVYEIVVSWDRPLPSLVEAAIASYQRKVGILIGLVFVSVAWLKWGNLSYFWYTPFFYVYSFTLLAYLMSRFLIAWRHRSPLPTAYEPTTSIIVAVRNDQDAITRTVESCFKTQYPAEKREVIVVDDGSKDRTLAVLKELQTRFPELKVFSNPPKGKRYAMAEGVRQSQGEIVVFVDSDTFLFPSSLRHIVCGFEDPTLGASAGYTEVENSDVNILTGLQEVRYYVSYRLLKSSESLFGCVTCCPGCLSAYRRSYVMEVLEPWLKQTFLGAPATFGDDRSLTNFILRKYRVIYNDLAVAATLVPENWGHYLRQQVRWKRSWLRETPIAARFMYKRHPVAALSFYAAALFSLFSPLMALRMIFLGFNEGDPVLISYALGLVLIALLQSLYFLYKRPSPHWLLGMLWMASSLVLTGPQTYYALLTLRKNHWGTR